MFACHGRTNVPFVPSTVLYPHALPHRTEAARTLALLYPCFIMRAPCRSGMSWHVPGQKGRYVGPCTKTWNRGRQHTISASFPIPQMKHRVRRLMPRRHHGPALPQPRTPSFLPRVRGKAESAQSDQEGKAFLSPPCKHSRVFPHSSLVGGSATTYIRSCMYVRSR